ncbi:PP2C family protein-serine/threonine phosphatase [Demequina sp. SO4-18]|uniref:PP2C family protein-serine/threonine phosphatase n=1 Tax=Demequina sp. SO4-18 TaxID=3401026 RepID=UPI003B5B5AED
MTVRWCAGAGATAPGDRPKNEDAFLSSGPVHVVADGMGGHLAGAAASSAVVEAFRELTDAATVDPDDVVLAVARAQEAVERLSERVGGSSGSTLTGAIAVEHDGQPWWMVINVGDSRVYTIEGGVLSQITVDHSYVQRLVERGDITPAQAEVHPDRNIVTRAIGDGIRDFDAWLVQARPGSRLVVASDGLMKALSDARIASIASLAGEVSLAAGRLVGAAVDAAASDNVTVVVVDTLHAHTDPDADPSPWRLWGARGDDDDTTISGRRRESV